MKKSLEEKQFELSLQVLKQFRLVYGSAKRHFKQVEKNCGVSGSQLWLLQEIVKSPGIGVTELSKLLSIHLSTCSILVNKLMMKKLIVKVRGNSDQRRVGLQATAAGTKALAKAPGPAEGVLPVALQELSEAELKRLHACMGQVIKKLQLLDEKSAEQPLADI